MRLMPTDHFFLSFNCPSRSSTLFLSIFPLLSFMAFMKVRNLRHLLCACLLLFSLVLECPLASKPCTPHFVVRVLAPSLSPSPPRTTRAGARLRRVLLGVLFGSLTGILLSLFTVFLFRFLLYYLNRTPILKGPVVFSPKISPRTLRQALADGARELGSSPNGKYYRVVLDNGLVVAVKRLEPMNEASPPSRTSDRRMQRELEVLARIRHRHLMTLRAYVQEPDRFSIVYDYVANGSLEDVMNRVRSNQLQLNWELRHRIAVGIVKGLWYLHYGCGRTILHYDLKPSNVLLDEELEPRLGDCGLSKLLPCARRDGSAFVAPECLQSCRYTDKSDIFSFGMILALLLTGRDPLDPFFGEMGGGSLGCWLRHLQQTGEAREGLDKAILGEEAEEDEMLMAVRIAVVCISDLPADRPSSDELVPMLAQLHSF